MTEQRSRLECLHCAILLTDDDRVHYAYACHACVLLEHELVLSWGREPDHPDAGRLFDGPVDLGLRPRPEPSPGAHR